MARPKKFRFDVDQVREPENAKRLAGFVGGIEELRLDAERIQQMIASLYDDADEAGFDKAVLRKTVARRAKNALDLEAEEYAVATYSMAVDMEFLSRARVRNSEIVDPETGEITETDRLKTEPLNNSPETATQSTAARKDEPTLQPDRPMQGAGTQAPPVDTIHGQEGRSGEGLVAREPRSEGPPQTLLSSDRVEGIPDAPGMIAGVPIPTPAGGGNTTEPDSGLELHGEVAAEPERSGLSPTDPPRSEAATRKDAETTAPAKRHELTEAAGNPNCQKLKRGEDCMFSHQGFSCAECNFIWATERQKARKRVAA